MVCDVIVMMYDGMIFWTLNWPLIIRQWTQNTQNTIEHVQ